MKLVIDANTVIAALLRDSVTRAIIVGGSANLVSPDYIKTEISENKEYIAKKAGLSKDEIDFLTALIFQKIEILPYPAYRNKIKEAKSIMDVDIEDVPYVPCYLALKCDGIWTNDRHYSDKPSIKVFKTKDLMTLL